MAFLLFGAKPLPEPKLTSCQLDPQGQTSVKLESKYNFFYCWSCIWIGRLRSGSHFDQGGDELKYLHGVYLHLIRTPAHMIYFSYCEPAFHNHPVSREIIRRNIFDKRNWVNNGRSYQVYCVHCGSTKETLLAPADELRSSKETSDAAFSHGHYLTN